MQECLEIDCQYHKEGKCTNYEAGICPLKKYFHLLNAYQLEILDKVDCSSFSYQEHFLEKVAYELYKARLYEKAFDMICKDNTNHITNKVKLENRYLELAGKEIENEIKKQSSSETKM